MPAPLDVLRDTFGFPAFREGQQPVVDRLLADRSVLAIFPTGGGKSLCYQLPALVLDGLTLVISPLIALMKDQLDFLDKRNVPAARLDSSLTATEARQVYQDLRSGRLKMLYVSPELLARRLAERPPGATVVYVTLQRTAEAVAADLARRGLPAKAYHAGLEAETRHAIQDWFMADDRAVVVATIAFGMGIDKANIRY